MRLIDTSAWVEFFRKQGALSVKRRVALHMSRDEAAYTGPVLFELISGARGREEIELIHEVFGLCKRYDFAAELWERAADLERALRSRGASVPRDDILVAAVAGAQRVPVLCRDAHFDLIREKGDPALQVEQV